MEKTLKLLSDRYQTSVPRDALVRALYRGGYLGRYASADEAVDRATMLEVHHAIKRYQSFNGLFPDGQTGVKTLRSMRSSRLCGWPDIIRLEPAKMVNAGLPCFNTNRIGWAVVGSWGAIPMSQIRQAFAWAFLQWSQVADLHFFETSEEEALIRIRTGPIDRIGGTLAFSGFANGDIPVEQKYDSLERWTFEEQPPIHAVDLGRVACHEIGHALGIPHIAAGNLLQPAYDIRIRKPQSGDIAEVQARYGPPKTQPLPEPESGSFVVTITGTGVVTGCKVSPA